MAVLRIFLLITLATFLIFSASTAAADGAPCSFSGTIRLDDSDTAGRILITATIEGDEHHAYAIEASGSLRYYYLTIRAPQGKEYSDGTKVTFEISGFSADQTGFFSPGANFKLDLTSDSAAGSLSDIGHDAAYSGSSNSGSKFNWGLAIGITFAALTIGALTYYIILIRRVARKGLLKQIPVKRQNRIDDGAS